MDRKFNRSRKLLIGMIVLVIIMSIEVQAIDLISTTFHLSSISISFPHLSKLDYFSRKFHNCFTKKITRCPNVEFDLKILAVCYTWFSYLHWQTSKSWWPSWLPSCSTMSTYLQQKRKKICLWLWNMFTSMLLMESIRKTFFLIGKPVNLFISWLKNLVYIRNNFIEFIMDGVLAIHVTKLSMYWGILCKSMRCPISCSSRVPNFNVAGLLHEVYGTGMIFAIAVKASVTPWIP